MQHNTSEGKASILYTNYILKYLDITERCFKCQLLVWRGKILPVTLSIHMTQCASRSHDDSCNIIICCYISDCRREIQFFIPWRRENRDGGGGRLEVKLIDYT